MPWAVLKGMKLSRVDGLTGSGLVVSVRETAFSEMNSLTLVNGSSIQGGCTSLAGAKVLGLLHLREESSRC